MANEEAAIKAFLLKKLMYDFVLKLTSIIPNLVCQTYLRNNLLLKIPNLAKNADNNKQ